MWHTIPFVAESLRLDCELLTNFALEHADKFGILSARAEPEVNTWHVDALVLAFRSADCDTLRRSAEGMR